MVNYYLENEEIDVKAMIWYEESNYQSQNWYSSTFLVHHFKDISRAKKSNKEWNNIEESGCHFTCISMIFGINPAYLASILRSGRKHYFLSDASLRSVRLNSKEDTYLVWDKNNPSTVGENIDIANIFIPGKGFCNAGIELVNIADFSSLSDASSWITNRRQDGLHIIAGPESHSFIVAGTNSKKEVVVWDPDTSAMNYKVVARMIKNGVSLKDVMQRYKISGSNRLQLLAYNLKIEVKSGG